MDCPLCGRCGNRKQPPTGLETALATSRNTTAPAARPAPASRDGVEPGARGTSCPGARPTAVRAARCWHVSPGQPVAARRVSHVAGPTGTPPPPTRRRPAICWTEAWQIAARRQQLRSCVDGYRPVVSLSITVSEEATNGCRRRRTEEGA